MNAEGTLICYSLYLLARLILLGLRQYWQVRLQMANSGSLAMHYVKCLFFGGAGDVDLINRIYLIC